MEKKFDFLEKQTKDGVSKRIESVSTLETQSPETKLKVVEEIKSRIGNLDECPDYLRETSHLKIGYRLNFNNCTINLKR
jgi:hypothetical protein